MDHARKERVSRTLLQSGLALVGVAFAVGSAYSDVRRDVPEHSRLVLGPVTAIDSTSASVTVLGQTFSVGQSTYGAGWTDGRVSVGDYVLAIGFQGTNVLSALVLARVDEQYVPGASPVFLRGPIDSANSALGVAGLGTALIDYTPALDGGTTGLVPGRVGEFLGTQPVIGGTIIASSFSASISGGDRLPWSISGGDSARLSISGGDSSSLSISGGDSAGLSISGGDRAGLSISGGDRSQLSISGGDSSRLSISGGDSAQLSISGGDHAQWSISGGDRAQLSISGGDSSQLSISGGDSSRLSISGGDSAQLSISGGDHVQWSISGGDRSQLSISGGDRSTLSISGGDREAFSISGGDKR